MSEKNILSHELVPEHKILAKDESQKILSQLNVKPDRLPKMRDTDPVVEIIGAKVGDIVEITRDSPTAGKTKYYRVVIPE